jgi:uncharacterized protein (TIGR02147 family)
LQDELVRRCRANPKYSLRAFARFLGLEPSHLSKILARKRVPTEPVIEKLGKRLGLSTSDITSLKSRRLAASSSLSADIRTSESEWRPLPLDSFQVIADWYHYAILELLSLPAFQKSDAKAIARALGISHPEAQAALERLERLMLIERQPDGRIVNSSGNNTTLGGPDTAPALRRLQKSVLEKALSALDEIPAELRDQSSMTMAIDTKLLPEARALIKKFRRDLSDLLQKSETRDSVYHLGVSLYPVARVDMKNGEKNEND